MTKTATPRTGAFISLVIMAVSLAAVFVIPVVILRHGYLPDDDALRHVGKVLSGKDWHQILILRDDIKLDPNLGWHAFLGVVQRGLNLNADALLSFSVVFLFFLFCALPVLVIRRPEAWLLSLIVMEIMPQTEVYLFQRLLRGRPYIITSAAMLLIGFLWPKLEDRKSCLKTAAAIALTVAASAYLHDGWYLFAVPIVCFLIARQWRAGILLAAATGAGVLAGVSLTGHPVVFLTQVLRHVFLAFSTHTSQVELVEELQAGTPSIFAIGAICLMLLWRRHRASRNLEVVRDPILVMVALCLVLGSLTRRVWFELGRPALCVWLTLEFQEYLESVLDRASYKRILLAALLAMTSVILVTSDFESRWSRNHPALVLSPSDAKLAQWLPEDGGIFYSPRMYLFYETFFRFPKANWRYMLGFEPGMMPPEDLAIYRNIQSANFTAASFEPWVRKMRPQDRLVISSNLAHAVYIKGLEWYDTGRGVASDGSRSDARGPGGFASPEATRMPDCVRTQSCPPMNSPYINPLKIDILCMAGGHHGEESSGTPARRRARLAVLALRPAGAQRGGPGVLPGP